MQLRSVRRLDRGVHAASFECVNEVEGSPPTEETYVCQDVGEAASVVVVVLGDRGCDAEVSFTEHRDGLEELERTCRQRGDR